MSSQKKEKEKIIHGFLTWNSFIIFLNFKAFGPKILFYKWTKILVFGLLYWDKHNIKHYPCYTELMEISPYSNTPSILECFLLSPPCSKPEPYPLSAFTEIRIRSDPYESPSPGSLLGIQCWPGNFLQMLNCLQRLFRSYPGFLKVNISSGTLGLNCTLFPFNLTAPAAFLVKSTVHYWASFYEGAVRCSLMNLWHKDPFHCPRKNRSYLDHVGLYVKGSL